jgi:hypothetical protein
MILLTDKSWSRSHGYFVFPASYVGYDSRFIVMLVPGKIVTDILHRWLAPEEFRNIASCPAQLSQSLQICLSHMALGKK